MNVEIHFAITMAYVSSTQFVSQQLATCRGNTSTLSHRRQNSLEQGGAAMCTIATSSSNYMYERKKNDTQVLARKKRAESTLYLARQILN